jgi:hypothetical protein
MIINTTMKRPGQRLNEGGVYRERAAALLLAVRRRPLG